MAIKLQGVPALFVVAAIVLAVASIGSVNAQWDPYFTENRTTIVHLFEWRWNDIAEECERFLGPKGFGGVQTSPPNENVIANKPEQMRPWWERYQPVSYKLETRSGTEEEFKSMVKRCNAVGVRVYPDAVINHMTYFEYWGTGTGTGGSWFDSYALNYTGVPYSNLDFNGPHNCHSSSGTIENYRDPEQVRNCKLGDPGKALNDLNQGSEWVQKKIIEYMNTLISYGVAGFRVDASKHMWPAHLKIIYDSLDPLSVEHGFPSGSRPFIVQEVIDNGGEAIAATEYYHLGRITEFKGCAAIGNIFRKWPQNDPGQLRYLGVPKRWGEEWEFMPDGSALAFVDNHDNQRGHGSGGASILTFRQSKLYKMAQAFTLAWPYGLTRVMSSYKWDQDFDQDGHDRNDWVGPPHDASYNTLPVTVNADLTCGNGWVCEHRWRQIYNMVNFRNVVKGTGLNDWWDNGKDQIAFSRGDRGFIAINNEDFPLNAVIQSGLPAGTYCDIISGNVVNGKCTGTVVTVGADRKVSVNLSNIEDLEHDPILALHVDARV